MDKSLLFAAIRGEETTRVPWVPFVGCHGGALIKTDAETYLKSSDAMVRGINEAIRLYDPDGIPVAFDLQIEAEALGCRLQWARENPPAVFTHVLQDTPLSRLKVPDETSGRFPVVFEALKNLKTQNPDVALYALVTGPFTLALHLKGTDLFIDMFDCPNSVHELLEFCTRVAVKTASMYMDRGCDVVALVDPMTSQISPESFTAFVSPYATEFFRSVRERNVYSSFFVCGHAQKNIEAMCRTGPQNVSIDENIPLDFVKQTCLGHGISFGGNLQLTVVLLMGSEDDIRWNTVECLDIGGRRGFILSPGCDLPYNVPAKNLQLVRDIVHDPYQQDVAREILRKGKETGQRINLADYGQSDRVIVDVITLDSEACAPCQYMVESVRSVLPHFKDLILWREHKIKEKESVEFMNGLMVKNIPTICIDGKITFVSTIPSPQELIRAIQDRINEKFGYRIRQKAARILVFGGKDADSETTWKNAVQAIKELGSPIELRRISDDKEIRNFGISATPSIITVREQLKSSGRIPSVEVIKEWIKALE